MANNSVDKLKLKSGEYFNFKPEGYDLLVEKIAELCRIAGIDTTKPSGGETPSDGGESSSAKTVKFRSNRKKTRVSITYTKRSTNTTNTVSKILEKMDTTYIVCSDDDLDSSKPINYTAYIFDSGNTVIEQISGETQIASNQSSTTVNLTFTEIIPSTYYLRVNGSEENSPVFYASHSPGKVILNIETNVDYNLRIYSYNGNYSYFTIDGQQYDKLIQIRNCSGDKTIEISFNAYDYVPSSIADFGPRKEETYSMNVYSYGAQNQNMSRGLEVTVEVTDKKYKDDVSTKFVKVIQNSLYAEEDMQSVDMSMSDDIKNGYLCPSGGSFTFQIKPKCYWYIYNEHESGFGVPNFMTFSPSEGGPSDNWINVTASWTSDKAHPTSFRTILMKICSVYTDKVVCEKKWDGTTNYTQKFRLLASQYTSDPSGESESSKGECPSRAHIEYLGFGILNSFVSTGLTQYGEVYPNNLLELYREEKEIEVYVKSNIEYKLERSFLPECVQNMVYVKSLNGSSEGKPGQHLYKFTLAENTTGQDRTIDIRFSSNDRRFLGATTSHIKQYATYKFDRNTESNEYSYIKEGTMWRVDGEYNNISIHTICHKPYVISARADYTYNVPLYTGDTFDNPHLPHENLLELNLLNVDSIDISDSEKYRGRFYIMLNKASTGGKNFVTGDNVLCFKLGESQKIRKVIG